MEKENQSCLLDSHTPDALVREFSEKHDCTNELLSLFRTTSHSGLKKLQAVFLALKNYEIIPLIEETQTSNRAVRYTATFVVLSKVKQIIKSKEDINLVDEIYNTVFKVRIRDVDPHIRALTLQFLADWACNSALFCRKDRLKELENALQDVSDLVRRRALRCIRRVLSHKHGKKSASLFNTEALVEIALQDANALLRREASLVSYILYSEDELISEPEIIKIMLHDKTHSRERKHALRALLPDGLHLLDRVHEVLTTANSIASSSDLSGSSIFKYLSINGDVISSFIGKIETFIRETSMCCSQPSLCFLDVLCELAGSAIPSDFIELLEITKDNKLNTQKIIKALQNVTSFTEQGESTAKILHKLCNMVLDEPFLAEEYIKLLSILKDSFTDIIDEIVNILLSSKKYNFRSILIKFFDITDKLNFSTNSLTCSTSNTHTCSTNTSTCSISSLESCYASLWFISKESFSSIADLPFDDSDNYLSLVLFLEFFFVQASKVLGTADVLAVPTVDIPLDTGTALVYVTRKLHKLISEYFYFHDEESCLHLFKLMDIGLFSEKVDVIFRHCSTPVLQELIKVTKAVPAMTTGYFNAVQENKELIELAKILAGRIPRKSEDRYLFTCIKPCLSKKSLLDKVIVYFVPYLSIEECIFIESVVPKSKLKSMCMRKIRGSTKNEQ